MVANEENLVTLKAWRAFFNSIWLTGDKDKVLQLIEMAESSRAAPHFPRVDDTEASVNEPAPNNDKKPRHFHWQLPKDVSQRVEKIFEALDPRCAGYVSVESLNQHAGPEWGPFISLEMDTRGDGKLNIETWMLFFNSLWSSSPKNLYLVMEAIESSLSTEETLAMGSHIQATARSRRPGSQRSFSQGPGPSSGPVEERSQRSTQECLSAPGRSQESEDRRQRASTRSVSPRRFLDYQPTSTFSMGDVYSARSSHQHADHVDERVRDRERERDRRALKLGEWMRMTTNPAASFVPPVSGLSICASPGGPTLKSRPQHERRPRQQQQDRSGSTRNTAMVPHSLHKKTPNWAQAVHAMVEQDPVRGHRRDQSEQDRGESSVEMGRAGGGHDWQSQEGYLPMHYPEATNLRHGTSILYEASHNFTDCIANCGGPPVTGRHSDYQAFIPSFNPSKPHSSRMGVPLVQRIPTVPGQSSPLPPVPKDLESCLMFHPIDHTGTYYSTRSVSPTPLASVTSLRTFTGKN